MNLPEVLSVAFVTLIIYVVVTVVLIRIFLKKRIMKFANQLFKKPEVVAYEK